MDLQISRKDLDRLSSKDMVPLKCLACEQVFYLPKRRVMDCLHRTKPKVESRDFCSNRCFQDHRHRASYTILSCDNCGVSFEKKNSHLKRSARHFCSQSCAATYNNKHKTYGIRRSKMEEFIESQIKEHFPDLEFVANGKEAIGSELDFYFPTLRLAIELNGIFHYEPIYGADTLKKIAKNDQQKSQRCYEEGIEFCTIDISSVKNLTQTAKEKYWGIVQSLLQSVYSRSEA